MTADRTWVAVDIETSGLSPCYHEVIEIGLVHSNGPEWSCSLPFNIARADPKALEINGWGVRDFARQHGVSYALGVMQAWFGSGELLVASPAHFDVGFLEATYRRAGARIPWGHRSIIDLKSFACAKFGEVSDLKNSAISERLHITDTSDHTALGDARWTADLFRGLVAL